jgi:molybdenum cofactor cytidylyltransferase
VTPRVGTIILAAGESRRLGKPKQLLQFRGQTLIRHAITSALGSICRPIVVVLGANAEAIEREVSRGVTVTVVRNAEWPSGMGSSIRCGLLAVQDQIDAVVLLLCDQPLIDSEILNSFADKAESRLVAAEYNGTIGVPALFGREFFNDLVALNGPEGARKMLLKNFARVTRLPCPEAGVDIDTAEDYERLRKVE